LSVEAWLLDEASLSVPLAEGLTDLESNVEIFCNKFHDEYFSLARLLPTVAIFFS